MRNDFSSNYLCHHGILGQKWGVRRYQNDDGSLTPAGRERYVVGDKEGISKISSAKGLSRRLNDVDTAIARNKRHYNENDAKANKFEKKSLKTKSDEKREEYKQKSENYRKEASKFGNNIERGQKEISSLLSRAEKAGYSVKSKDVRRSVAEGRDAITELMTLAVVNAITIPTTGWAVVGTAGPTVKGTHYKVKEKKK